MDFFLENIKEVVEAINKMIARNVGLVDTKRVRMCNGVKSSNKSKVNFIWRSLKYLNEHGYIEVNGAAGRYTIPKKAPFDVDEVIEYAKEHRK